MLNSFAEKIAKYCSRKSSKALPCLLNKGGKRTFCSHKTMRIPFRNMPKNYCLSSGYQSNRNKLGVKLLHRPAPIGFRLKQMKKIPVNLLFKAKPITINFRSFYQSAFDANKACRAQDLHLFKLKQIYFEKNFHYKDISPWKLPKAVIIETQINYYLNKIKDIKSTRETQHSITKILIGKATQKAQEDLERLNKHLDLQKQQQDRRNFRKSGSIFNGFT